MRRIILRTLLVLAILAAAGLGWIFGGRQLALFVDRFGTVEVQRAPITQFGYDGPERGGLLRLGGGFLGTTGLDHQPFPLRIAPDANNKLALTTSGRSFLLGELFSAPPQDSGAAFTVQPEKDDKVLLIVRRSLLSWPTPFDFNFMTGHAPSWKRHYYHELVWKKRSGAKLEMLWRYEQYFYPTDGWTEGNMTHEGTTGLIKVEITDQL
ncbi:MAG: hypothetical protein QOF24_2637 [Verrucomicrobiota bacterium]|jgi:hypothetical protein